MPGALITAYRDQRPAGSPPAKIAPVALRLTACAISAAATRTGLEAGLKERLVFLNFSLERRRFGTTARLRGGVARPATALVRDVRIIEGRTDARYLARSPSPGGL
jgi:hypothetical protein